MKKTIVFFCLFFTSLVLFSQDFIQEDQPVSDEPKKMSFRDRLVFGGGFGLQFGTYTNVEISPLAGFRITEDWIAGGGFSYQFISSRSQDFSTSIYGPRIFTNYMLIVDFFVHVEYEALSLESELFSYNSTEERFWVESFLIGGGYRMRINDRSSINLMLLYNLNESIYSPYSNPVIRVGFYL